MKLDSLRLFNIALAAFILAFIAGCCGGYGCDHAFRPDWDKRHNKFRDWLGDERNKQYPTHLMCNSARHPKVTPDSDTITYAFVSDPHPGCTYYCVVDKKTNQILDTRFEGTKEACSLTLN